jgi:hypothetical protein
MSSLESFQTSDIGYVDMNRTMQNICTLMPQTPPRKDTGTQNLVVPFGELAYAPAVQLCMIRRLAFFLQTARMEVCRDSTGSYPNPRTTS